MILRFRPGSPGRLASTSPSDDPLQRLRVDLSRRALGYLDPRERHCSVRTTLGTTSVSERILIDPAVLWRAPRAAEAEAEVVAQHLEHGR